jgi:hypothetical protein
MQAQPAGTSESETDRRPWWLRLRSFVLLVALLAGIGVTVAAVIGVVVLVLSTVLDQALG